MGKGNGAGTAGTLPVLFTILGQSQPSRAESRRHRCGAIKKAIFVMRLGSYH